ncbi:MAG: hypothetical protein OEY97_11935 [Nitrospirota bacterium]|nr:hypothetical protein [Nitrospirota bacterium]
MMQGLIRGITPMVAALALCACATQHTVARSELSGELAAGAPRPAVFGSTVAPKDTHAGPPLVAPIRLAVVFREPENRPTARYASRWTEQEKDLGWLQPLLNDGVLSDVVLLSGTVTTARTLGSLRDAAHNAGADAVLVLDAAGDAVRNINRWAWAYITIIGGWIVPGTRVDALAVVQGTLWGPEGDAPYLSVSSDGEAYRLAPAFLLRTDRVMTDARRVALDGFYTESARRLRGVLHP